MVSDDVWNKTFSKYFDADNRAKSAAIMTAHTMQDAYKGTSKRIVKPLPYNGIAFNGTLKQFNAWLAVMRQTY